MTVSSAKILVIEDDRDWRQALCEILVNEGYAVETASSRDRAVEWISDGGEPSLVITDLMMPGMDSATLAKALARLGFGDVPVIAMSAANETEVHRLRGPASG